MVAGHVKSTTANPYKSYSYRATPATGFETRDYRLPAIVTPAANGTKTNQEPPETPATTLNRPAYAKPRSAAYLRSDRGYCEHHSEREEAAASIPPVARSVARRTATFPLFRLRSSGNRRST